MLNRPSNWKPFFSWPNTEKPYHKKAHLSVKVPKLNNPKSWTSIKGPLKKFCHLYGSWLYYRPQPKCNIFFREILQKKPPPSCRTWKWICPKKNGKETWKKHHHKAGWIVFVCLQQTFFQVDHHPQLLQISWLVNLLFPPIRTPPRRHSRPYEDENPKPLASNNKALLLNPYEFLKGVGFQPPLFQPETETWKAGAFFHSAWMSWASRKRPGAVVGGVWCVFFYHF